MADILFQCMTLAATTSTNMVTKNIVIVMQTAQSIDRAASLNKLALIGYIATLFIVAVMTFLSWWAGSHLQDAIQKDADARIAEANGKAATANENAGKANERAGIANEAAAKANDSAAKANERAQKLESDNIQLRMDLERATAEARDRQAELAREQGKLAAEQQKTAKAQEQAAIAQLALRKHLEEVAARQADRTLSKGFRNVHEIDRGNIWSAIIRYKAGDDEAFRFAREIANRMRAAGWSIDEDPRPISKDDTIDPVMASFVPGVRPGLTILPPSRSYGTYKENWGQILEEDLTAAGFKPFMSSSTSPYLIIIVGSKGDKSIF